LLTIEVNKIRRPSIRKWLSNRPTVASI